MRTIAKTSVAAAMVAGSASARASTAGPRGDREQGGLATQTGSQTAVRLTRELVLLEASLAAAERAAISSRSARLPDLTPSDSDIAGRRAELDRRALALAERERSLALRRRLVDEAHEKLVRAKDSLKRAIRRFRSHVAQQEVSLDERAQRLDAAHADLIENRRELARNEMRLKMRLRMHR